jgi:signal transduction histidine kinase
VCDALPPPARPHVVVEVDPTLDLDRRTATIAYRIAQEALLTAVLHSGARSITTRVLPDEATGGLVVEVADDGAGLDLGTAAGGGCLTALELFTELGHGELTIRAVPGAGTTVRSRLGGRTPDDAPVPTGRHLRVV